MKDPYVNMSGWEQPQGHAAMTDLHPMNTSTAIYQWVSVHDRMPRPDELNEDGDVLVSWGAECHFAAVASVSAETFYSSGSRDSTELPDVTHWMKLPPPPDAAVAPSTPTNSNRP